MANEEELVNNQPDELPVNEPVENEPVEEPTDVEGEQPEVYEDEKEYLGKYDFAKDAETLDDAMERANALWRENQRLKAQPVEPYRPDPAPKPDQPSEYLQRGAYSRQVEDAIKAGMIASEGAAAARQWAKMQDAAADGNWEKTETALSKMYDIMQKQAKRIRDYSWTLSPKETKEIGRDNLDKIMDTYNLDDYRIAANLHVALNDPDLLTRLATEARKNGQQQARTTQMKRFSSATRSKPTMAPATTNFKPYLTPDGQLDQKKLARLSTDGALKIVEAYEKHLAGGSR